MMIEDEQAAEKTALAEQIARCRRIAQMTVDDDVRHALEQLAREYEARLPEHPEHGDSFMLGSNSPREGRAASAD